jgi:predicted nucleic acid-binding protein
MVVIDANIFIAFALNDEPLHVQANQLLSAYTVTRTTGLARDF